MEQTPTEDDPCPNCGTSSALKYCPECGQRRHLRPLGFGALLWDLLAEVLDTDARVWRTLRSLVLRPGQLTQDWAKGRRARYLPPFRIYFVLSVLAFLVLSVDPGDPVQLALQGDGASITDQQDLQDLLAELEREGALPPGTVQRQALPPDVGKLPMVHDDSTLDLGGVGDWLVALGYSREQVHQVVRRALANPGDALQLLRDRLPVLMVLLLPLLTTIMRAFYLLSPRPWVVYLVGLVHLHAFGFLLLLLAEGFAGFALLLSALGLPMVVPILVSGADFAVLLVIPWYLFRWLRVVLGHGRAGAAAMTAVMLILHAVAALAGFVGLLLVTLALEVMFAG